MGKFSTGYGQQCAQLAPLLAEAGHDVALSAFYGVQGSTLGWQDPKSGQSFRVYGNHLHPYGDDIILGHASNHMGGDLRAGWVLTLIDVWVYNAAQFPRVNLACWVPVDHDPLPERVLTFLETSGAVPIAMSRFGERMMRDAGLEPLYAPHGIDTGTFKPQPRADARAALGLPQDAFLIGMVAANKGSGPSRKGWSPGLQAFAKLRARHEDALLYLHTEVTGACDGTNLPALTRAVGLPDGAVVHCDQYRLAAGGYSQEYMATAYAAMDVLLNPALGEGFGVPIIEAQACGTPVVATAWTSMLELVGAGWLADGDKLFTAQQSWWKEPRVDELAEYLERCYQLGAKEREELRAQARDFALQYDSRRVFDEHWQPVLESLEERLAPLVMPSELITVGA